MVSEQDLPADGGASDGVRRAFWRGVATGCGVSMVLPALLGVALLVAMAVLVEMGVLVDNRALPGDRVDPSTLKFLQAEGFVSEDEGLLYFYSDGTLSVREDGNLFTDRRVVSYWEDDHELYSEEAWYHEVASIDFRENDSFWGTSEVDVTRLDNSVFKLLVSNEGDSDRAFVDLLRETWEARRLGDPVRRGGEVRPQVVEFLRSSGFLREGEELDLFYSKSSGPLAADGNLLTNQRVVSYWQAGDELRSREASLEDIASVELRPGEGPHGVSVIVVRLAAEKEAEGGEFELWASPQGGGDRAFVEALEAALGTAQDGG